MNTFTEFLEATDPRFLDDQGRLDLKKVYQARVDDIIPHLEQARKGMLAMREGHITGLVEHYLDKILSSLGKPQPRDYDYRY
jgi:hypothetical protein